jgi:hypothetical protein
MERQLGHSGLVAWQGRSREGHRASPVETVLAAIVVLSAIALGLRFIGGLDLPLELLQAAFAFLVGAGALLLTRWAVSAILRRQDR